MTDLKQLRASAAQARSAAARGSAAEPMTSPMGRPERPELRFSSQMRAKKVNKDGMDWYVLEGHASITERGYNMWDYYGPYTEVVSAEAFTKTLAAQPEVVFRFNHAGMPMASTSNKRLELWTDEHGLADRAYLNPKRADVQDLIHAIDDEDVREQSFMFTITSGRWSPDYDEYRIDEVDLERGDVGPVTYGANPHTTIAARSGELLAAIPNLPPLVAREAYSLLSQRTDLAPPPQSVPPAVVEPVAAPLAQLGLGIGRSLSLAHTQLLVAKAEAEDE